MKQLMVAIFMVSFVIGAGHKREASPPEQDQHNQVQAVPVGVLAELKNALRQPKTLGLLSSMVALQLVSSYGDWSPETILIMGIAKYVAGAAVCERHLPDVYVIYIWAALAGVFWYQYADMFWGIQESAIQSTGRDRGIVGNLAHKAAENLASYIENKTTGLAP